MNGIIYKYELPRVAGRMLIRVFDDYKMLDLQKQGGIPCIWMLYSTTSLKQVNIEVFALTNGIEIIGTDDLVYLGTAQFDDGRYVLHYFYKPHTNDIQTHTTTSRGL